MNIQIFGTSKCFDTKKAQRYFKERGIKFQMIDLKEKEMSRGEFENVARALGGWEQLVNPAAKDKQTLALLYLKDADFAAVLAKADALRAAYDVTVLPQAKKLGKQFGTLEAAGYNAVAFADNDDIKVLGQKAE